MSKPAKIALTSALWGEKYLKYAPRFLQSLNRQTTTNFDILLYLGPGLEPILHDLLDRHAPKIHPGRIKIIPLDENKMRLTTLTTTAFRIDHFLTQDYTHMAWLDMDDYIPDRYMEIMPQKMGQHEAGIAVADFNVVDDDGSVISPAHLTKRFGEGIITFDDILFQNFIGCSNLWITRDALLQTEHKRLYDMPDDMISAPDWPMATVAIARGVRAVLLSAKDDAAIYYCQHPDNVSRFLDPDVKKAYLLKQAFYPDLSHQDLRNTDHQRKATVLAAAFTEKSTVFFHQGQPTPAFRAYEIANHARIAGRNDLVWWESAFSPQDVESELIPGTKSAIHLAY